MGGLKFDNRIYLDNVFQIENINCNFNLFKKIPRKNSGAF